MSKNITKMLNRNFLIFWRWILKILSLKVNFDGEIMARVILTYFVFGNKSLFIRFAFLLFYFMV